MRLKGVYKMVNNSEIADLSEIYNEMDTEGKKKIVWMAKQLLSVQLVGKNQTKDKEKEKFENHD
jgi:hypothetical protein